MTTRPLEPGDAIRARPNFCAYLYLCYGPEADIGIKIDVDHDWYTQPRWNWSKGAREDVTWHVTPEELLVVLEVAPEPGTRNTWVKVFNSHMQFGWLRADWVRRVDL